MIAYNYYIKFVPELGNEKNEENPLKDVIIIKKSSLKNLPKNLNFEIKYFNNQGRDLLLCTDRKFKNTEKGQLWAFEVKDVITFFWYSEKLILEYITHENYTEDLLKYWSLHTLLPVFFNIEGRYKFLHAGAVKVDNEPILFIADSHGGKSTLTDYFVKQGHPLISDDKVPVFEEKGFYLLSSSHAHYRPYRNIEDLGCNANNFSMSVNKIKNIYLLQKTLKDSDIKIIEVKGVEKYKAIRKSYDIELSFMNSELFDFTSKLSNQINLYIIHIPWDKKRLIEVYDKIIGHTKK